MHTQKNSPWCTLVWRSLTHTYSGICTMLAASRHSHFPELKHAVPAKQAFSTPIPADVTCRSELAISSATWLLRIAGSLQATAWRHTSDLEVGAQARLSGGLCTIMMTRLISKSPDKLTSQVASGQINGTSTHCHSDLSGLSWPLQETLHTLHMHFSLFQDAFAPQPAKEIAPLLSVADDTGPPMV